jgi:hypothetical protein
MIYVMENKKARKSLIEYIDNRDGMIIGFSFVVLAFIMLITFYLLQKPTTDLKGIFYPTNMHK